MRSSALRRSGALVALTLLLVPATAEAWRPPPRPDLVVRSLSAPPGAARPGARFTVNDTVTNRGRTGARGTWTSYTLTGRRRLWLGERAVPALRPGVTSSGQSALTIPPSARDGVYALVA